MASLNILLLVYLVIGVISFLCGYLVAPTIKKPKEDKPHTISIREQQARQYIKDHTYNIRNIALDYVDPIDAIKAIEISQGKRTYHTVKEL